MLHPREAKRAVENTARTHLLTQFARILDLKPGWYEGEGKVPSRVGVEWLRDALLHQLKRYDLPMAFPVPDGNILLEWQRGGREISLEVDLDDQRGLWHDMDMKTDSVVEESLDLLVDESWNRIREWLK